VFLPSRTRWLPSLPEDSTEAFLGGVVHLHYWRNATRFF
jgi:hypothetical protein